MKDHEIAGLVNRLTEIAKKHHDKQCLRELISREITDTLSKELSPLSDTLWTRCMLELLPTSKDSLPLKDVDERVIELSHLPFHEFMKRVL